MHLIFEFLSKLILKMGIKWCSFLRINLLIIGLCHVCTSPGLKVPLNNDFLLGMLL